MKIEVAVIGAGRIGQIHAGNAARNPSVRLAGVADAVPEAARALAEQLGTRVMSVEEIMAAPTVHAVLICSSTDTHADLIQRSVAAGKHVFCEKPVDLDLARARAVCREAMAFASAMIRKDPAIRDSITGISKLQREAKSLGLPETITVPEGVR